ncbi:hypothetical protein SLEP1_g31083 [Rubroshorea leprosula]|uniref:Zinc finger PHD-type domain-containing protein n=1 Tax=Rubroshorea leprosula TaxID=152421 RepID=A0AAV5K4N0_9ROSI|nr:hypothetical protein SLEP1_g31083 [Rubroshorea leprosula]
METEEEEPLTVPNPEPSLPSDRNVEATATLVELQPENTQLQCEPESVVELGGCGSLSQPQAPTIVSVVVEKEEQKGSKGVVDGEESLGAVGVGDLIGGEENRGVLEGGDSVEPLPTIGGENGIEVGVDGQQSFLVEEDKSNTAGDVAVGDESDETEVADIAGERETVGGIEVADVVEKDQILEETEGSCVAEQIEILEETVVVAVADGRGTNEIEVSDVAERTEIPEEKEVIDVSNRSRNVEVLQVDERTDIPEQTEVAMKVDGRFATKNEVADMAEQTQTAFPEGKGEEKQENYLTEQTGLANMDGEMEILEEKLPDVSQETGILEETNLLMEGKEALETDIAEEADDTEMGDETENEDDREMATAVEEETEAEMEEADIAEGTAMAELTDGLEEVAEEMEEADIAEGTAMAELTDGLEEVAEEMEEAKEVEEVGKTGGGKRKRGKNSKALGRAPSRKKAEEDVCFICYDGGDLVLCDRRGCPKAYHSSCVGRDEAFFQTKGQWNCGLLQNREACWSGLL